MILLNSKAVCSQISPILFQLVCYQVSIVCYQNSGVVLKGTQANCPPKKTTPTVNEKPSKFQQHSTHYMPYSHHLYVGWFKLNAPNRAHHEMPERNIYSNGIYLVSYWPPWTAGEGGMASCFCKGLGLALEAKICPNQPQALTSIKYSQQVFFCPFFFPKEPIAGTLKACL